MARKCPVDRLFEYVRDPDECWEWPGSNSGNGYGRISVNGETRATHIVFWELYHGERVPEGKVLDHTCRNRACFNPHHLVPKTILENTLIGEGPTAKNAAKTHCKRGHELVGDNLITRVRDGRPRRECRECKRIRRHEARGEVYDPTKYTRPSEPTRVQSCGCLDLCEGECF